MKGEYTTPAVIQEPGQVEAKKGTQLKIMAQVVVGAVICGHEILVLHQPDAALVSAAAIAIAPYAIDRATRKVGEAAGRAAAGGMDRINGGIEATGRFRRTIQDGLSGRIEDINNAALDAVTLALIKTEYELQDRLDKAVVRLARLVPAVDRAFQKKDDELTELAQFNEGLQLENEQLVTDYINLENSSKRELRSKQREFTKKDYEFSLLVRRLNDLGVTKEEVDQAIEEEKFKDQQEAQRDHALLLNQRATARHRARMRNRYTQAREANPTT